jgi:peptidoglycan/xylan/chitin deacetylase (PgdA/CDA1 family)
VRVPTRRVLRTLGFCLLTLAAVAVGLRLLARSRTTQVAGRLVARVEIAEPLVALTFDDGPDAAYMDGVLGALAARRVRATFFVTGAELAATPDAGRRLVAAGHELGNHSWSHPRMVFKSPQFVREEIARTDAAIRDAGQHGEIQFRPPFGYKLVVLPWVLSRAGRTTIMWDVEPDSYPDVAATAGGIVAHVVERVRPGSIVLLHVWYPTRQTSRDAVPLVVDALHAKRYRFVTVSELLERRQRES